MMEGNSVIYILGRMRHEGIRHIKSVDPIFACNLMGPIAANIGGLQLYTKKKGTIAWSKKRRTPSAPKLQIKLITQLIMKRLKCS